MKKSKSHRGKPSFKKEGFVALAFVALSGVPNSGCAFKTSDPVHSTDTSQKPESLPAPRPSQTEPKPGQSSQHASHPRPVRNLTVGWKRENEAQGQVVRELLVREDLTQHFFVAAPISIPASVPDEIKVQIALDPIARLREAQAIEVKAGASATVLVPTQILRVTPTLLNYVVQETEFLIDLTLTGIRNLLPDSESSHVFITVELRELESGFRLGTIQFQLVTPPSQISVKQMTVSEYESAEASLEKDWHRLRSGTRNWDLLQVVTIKSAHGSPVLLDAPTQIQGKLLQHNTTFYSPSWDNRLLCKQEREIKPWVKEFSNSLLVLPLNSDLSAKWLEWSAFKSLSIGLSSEKDLLLGIFAQNNADDDLNSILGSQAPSGIQKRRLPIATTERVPTSCDFACQSPRGMGHFSNQCAPIVGQTKKAKCEELVTKCRGCLERHEARGLPWEHPEESGNDCNECRVAELTLNDELQYSRDEPKYYRVSPCEFSWKAVPRDFATLKFGTEYAPILLEIESPVESIQARFAPTHEHDHTESRIQRFLKNVTVQSQ